MSWKLGGRGTGVEGSLFRHERPMWWLQRTIFQWMTNKREQEQKIRTYLGLFVNVGKFSGHSQKTTIATLKKGIMGYALTHRNCVRLSSDRSTLLA